MAAAIDMMMTQKILVARNMDMDPVMLAAYGIEIIPHPIMVLSIDIVQPAIP
jgi:hypothetical protein